MDEGAERRRGQDGKDGDRDRDMDYNFRRSRFDRRSRSRSRSRAGSESSTNDTSDAFSEGEANVLEALLMLCCWLCKFFIREFELELRGLAPWPDRLPDNWLRGDQ